ncbi:hypothetical protein L3Y34_016153 [Caenorhabditis briggsae]|nr:hypothetical protein L3Y34_016153 [Caenorhabditis briggsae]
MARYGSETPVSAAGSMTGCRFSTGSCNTREAAVIDDLAPRSPRGFTKCRLAGQKLHRPIPRIGYVRMPFYTHWYS